jgi:hypothetical protein
VSGSQTSEESTRRTLQFPNGNRAFVVAERADRGDDADALVRRVGLSEAPARPVIVVCGGANLLKAPHLAFTETVLGPAVARAAGLSGAVVVDGGTAAGVMAVVGAAVSDLGSSEPVVGVAPRGRIRLPDEEGSDRSSLEPHHSHFLLADSDEWGGERRLLFDVAAALAGTCRVVVVLAGGGPLAQEETLEAVRRGWPVVVLRGSGSLADELADKVAVARRRPRLSLLRGVRRARRKIAKRRAGHPGPSTSVTRRILRVGDLRIFTERDPAGLARWLTWELGDESVLKDAWRMFTGYDRRATALRRTFERVQRAVIGFGILATAVALVYDESKSPVLRWATIAAPAVIALTVAVASRRAAGKRWVLLRGAAEALRIEIYRYRTRTGPYAAGETSTERTLRADVLSKRLKAIDAQLVQTEAASGPMEPDTSTAPPRLPEKADDGISSLDASRYAQLRVQDQIEYYRGKVGSLNRLRNRLQFVSLAVGGGGTVLAAAGAEVWIALTTAVSAGAVSYLSTLQVDTTIVAYNQSAVQLAGIRRDWLATRDEAAFEQMVTRAEQALSSELSGWVQQMNNAIEANEASLAAEHGSADGRDRVGSG